MRGKPIWIACARGHAAVCIALCLMVAGVTRMVAQPPSLLGAAQVRALAPKATFRECENCPEMVVLPAGSFAMGAPADEPGRIEQEGRPQHVVTFAKPFAVGKYHVTVGEFAAFVKDAGPPPGAATCQNFAPYLPDPEPAVPNGPVEVSWHATGYKQTDRFPVGCMSWNDAHAYVTWLAKKTGRPYRLLSEAEFEYAVRGQTAPGASPPFFFGSNAKDICKYANGADAALAAEIKRAGNDPQALGPAPYLPCDDGHAFVAPVGSFPPNAFGLYDIEGNLTQWLADCFHDTYVDAPTDGSAWLAEQCEEHMMRGASWDNNAGYFRSAMRMWAPAQQNNPQLGFRVARTLE